MGEVQRDEAGGRLVELDGIRRRVQIKNSVLKLLFHGRPPLHSLFIYGRPPPSQINRYDRRARLLTVRKSGPFRKRASNKRKLEEVGIKSS